MTDIVEQLRGIAVFVQDRQILAQAADRIEELAAQHEALIRRIADLEGVLRDLLPYEDYARLIKYIDERRVKSRHEFSGAGEVR